RSASPPRWTCPAAPLQHRASSSWPSAHRPRRPWGPRRPLRGPPSAPRRSAPRACSWPTTRVTATWRRGAARTPGWWLPPCPPRYRPSPRSRLCPRRSPCSPRRVPAPPWAGSCSGARTTARCTTASSRWPCRTLTRRRCTTTHRRRRSSRRASASCSGGSPSDSAPTWATTSTGTDRRRIATGTTMATTD
ncbi:unnamed protein product, partial [Ixodes pacificus]